MNTFLDVPIDRLMKHSEHTLKAMVFGNAVNLTLGCEDCQEVISDVDIAFCEICDEYKPLDDMAHLPGDVYTPGFAPEARPGCCIECAEKR